MERVIKASVLEKIRADIIHEEEQLALVRQKQKNDLRESLDKVIESFMEMKKILDGLLEPQDE